MKRFFVAFGISKVLKKNNYFQLKNKFCSWILQTFENDFTNVVQTCLKFFFCRSNMRFVKSFFLKMYFYKWIFWQLFNDVCLKMYFFGFFSVFFLRIFFDSFEIFFHIIFWFFFLFFLWSWLLWHLFFDNPVSYF